MADFDAYSRAASKALGAGAGVSGITEALGTPEHNFTENTQKDIMASTDPLIQASILDINDWSPETVDFSKMKSAGSAYMEWKKNLNSPFNIRANNFARQNNLDNFAAFKQMYDAQIATYAPMVQNKLLNFQNANFLSDSQMRDFINQNTGLQGVLRQAPPQLDAQGLPIPPPAWTMPKETWGQTVSRKTSESMTGAPTLAALRAGQVLYGMGTEGFGKYMERRSPFGKKSVFKPDNKAIAKALGVDITRGKASMTKVVPQTKATKAYNKAKKLYEKNQIAEIRKKQPRGKIAQSKLNAIKEFDKTKEGKKLLKSKTSAQAANKAQQSIVKGKPAKVVAKFIKKHGMSGLYKKVVKKVGRKGALKLLTKGALGMGLKGTGVGAAAGIALDALTIYQLYKIITTD